ncbi:hypothetical protein [Alicyclobacillus acidocaldarius]|uniref:Uncharacterized protein n=1 Tax=Alicyclobacillus acidocaldarius (strain Tc-4-1) TaxID=1048834 RepID=F8ID18_ALIAT|nr:hypothetical protein [Alicyclobacillus acidocaldarius]AEJ45023.1 hypothetical protein TC41_3140 [Alicyclobacillus acidocaldarius subsp. acidocaldarius Tc-4-1]
MNAKPQKAERIPGVALAKAQASRPANGRGTRRAAARSGGRNSAPAQSKAGSKAPAPSQLLTPKNMQDTLKTVGNLRNMVKNWLNYLQQADKMLDTFYVTTGALKESGVLDKLIKFKGRNLTTEDFTNILAALLSSPLAEGFLKGSGGNSGNSGESASAHETAGSAQSAQSQPSAPNAAPMQQPPQAQQAPGPAYAPPAYAPYAAPMQPYAAPQPMYGAPPPYPYYGPPPAPVPPPTRPATGTDGGRATN